MENKTLLTRSLKNGLTLVCTDQSKRIAADRWYISVITTLTIPVDKKWLDGFSLTEEEKSQICLTLGDSISYRQTKERNFISADEKDRVVQQLCENASKLGDTYLSHEKFPGKYMLKRYTEKKGAHEIR